MKLVEVKKPLNSCFNISDEIKDIIDGTLSQSSLDCLLWEVKNAIESISETDAEGFDNLCEYNQYCKDQKDELKENVKHIEKYVQELFSLSEDLKQELDKIKEISLQLV